MAIALDEAMMGPLIHLKAVVARAWPSWSASVSLMHHWVMLLEVMAVLVCVGPDCASTTISARTISPVFPWYSSLCGSTHSVLSVRHDGSRSSSSQSA